MNLRETKISIALDQWNRGDPEGLRSLMEEHLPWLQNHIRKRLGAFFKKKAQTCDYVQDAVLQFLQYAPRIHLSDEGHFRALLVHIAENSLRDKNEWYNAKRRAMAQEKPLPSDTVLSLDPPKGGCKTPSQSVERHEREAWVRLGLEFMDHDDREIIVLRQWDGLSFAELGERIGISKDATRMKYNRAVRRLGEKVWALRRGKLNRFENESLT